MDFYRTQKRAMFILLSQISMADGENHIKENIALVKDLNMSEEDLAGVQSMFLDEASEIVRKMPDEKKLAFTKMIFNVLHSDGVVRKSEILKIDQILKMTAIKMNDFSQVDVMLHAMMTSAKYKFNL